MDPKFEKELTDRLADLGLAPGATFDDVRKSYLHLIFIHHPDRNAGDPNAHTKCAVINDAFDYIKACKDELPFLAGRRTSPPPPPPPPSNQTAPPNPRGGPIPDRHVPAVPQTSWYSARPLVLLTVVAVLGAAFFARQAHVVAQTAEVEHMSAQWERAEARDDRQRVDKFFEEMTRAEQAPRDAEEKSAQELAKRGGTIGTSEFPAFEISQLTGANEAELDDALTRAADIDADGRMEQFVTGLKSTCRHDGCPVYLIMGKPSKPNEPQAPLCDGLPANHGWHTLTVTNHMTRGARDIIVTETTSAGRTVCRRLIWDTKTKQYEFDDEDPTPAECAEADKHAWNIDEARPTRDSWGR
jgi:hypothetical protein